MYFYFYLVTTVSKELLNLIAQHQLLNLLAVQARALNDIFII